MKQINIRQFKVNDMQSGSTITFNRSVQMAIHATRKKNQGFGENNSDASAFDVMNTVMDQDVADNLGISQRRKNGREGA